MIFDSDILNWLWTLVGIPLAYIYRQNSRITTLETTQSINTKTLDSINERLCEIEKNTAEINGILKEHLRTDINK